MEANWVLPAAFALALLGVGGGAGGAGLSQCTSASNSIRNTTLREIYMGELGVREATDRNDGPRVGEYLRYCDLGEGYEWCAAFVSWCHKQAGFAEPRNAWAAALFPSRRTVWAKNQRLEDEKPKAGDVFGIYIPSKKRIGHCGFVDEWSGKWVITVEGNVNNAVMRKRRLVSTIYMISRWTS